MPISLHTLLYSLRCHLHIEYTVVLVFSQKSLISEANIEYSNTIFTFLTRRGGRGGCNASSSGKTSQVSFAYGLTKQLLWIILMGLRQLARDHVGASRISKVTHVRLILFSIAFDALTIEDMVDGVAYELSSVTHLLQKNGSLLVRFQSS